MSNRLDRRSPPPVAVAMLTLTACGGSDSGGGAPNAAPTDKVLHLSFLQDPGQPPDPDVYYAGQGLLLTTNPYEGLLQYKGGHRQARIRAAAGHRVDRVARQQGVHLQAARGREVPRRHAVHLGRGQGVVRPAAGRQRGPAYMVADVESVTTQGDYGVTITLKAPNSAVPGLPRLAVRAADDEPDGAAEERRHRPRADLSDHPRPGHRPVHADRRRGRARTTRWQRSANTGAPSRTSRRSRCPVITDTSAQQLQFNNGQLAAILHDLPSSAVRAVPEQRQVRRTTRCRR